MRRANATRSPRGYAAAALVLQAARPVLAPEDVARAEAVLAPRAEAGEVHSEVDQARGLDGLRS
eukprot:5804425-Alexandrium_andersonii.AAC.1